MVSLSSASELRTVQRLPFCYICGNLIASNEKATRDHVPPQGVFAIEHRQPLILRAHLSCNKSHETHDQHMSQLIGLRRDYLPREPKHRRLKFQVFKRHNDEGYAATVETVDIKTSIWGWVRGFHAALYREFLPEKINRAIELPFPEVESLVDGRPKPAPIRPQRALFVALIKMNRAASNLDTIVSNAGNLRYECVWGEADPGVWRCVFALDVYDWRDLGPPELRQRGCVGLYELESPPLNATHFTTEKVDFSNADPLNPFES